MKTSEKINIFTVNSIYYWLTFQRFKCITSDPQAPTHALITEDVGIYIDLENVYLAKA